MTAKNKGSKNFMTLSRAECIMVSQDCIANSDSKYSDALILAGAGSYGNATSQLLLSLEEMIKGIVLSLDGNGFEFRSRVDGINNLFMNHKLRYFSAFILSVMNIFGKDMKTLFMKIVENPDAVLNFKLTDQRVQQRVTLYLILKIKSIQKEINWFSNADMYRQDGFYVDYVDKLKTPLNISKDDFLSFKLRIDNFRIVGKELILAFDLSTNTPELKKEIMKLQRRFIEIKSYAHLGNLVKKLNNRSYNFDQLSETISKFSIDMVSDLKQKKFTD